MISICNNFFQNICKRFLTQKNSCLISQSFNFKRTFFLINLIEIFRLLFLFAFMIIWNFLFFLYAFLMRNIKSSILFASNSVFNDDDISKTKLTSLNVDEKFEKLIASNWFFEKLIAFVNDWSIIKIFSTSKSLLFSSSKFFSSISNLKISKIINFIKKNKSSWRILLFCFLINKFVLLTWSRCVFRNLNFLI